VGLSQIDQHDIDFVFKGLSRPECVLCTASAGIFVSHDPIGVQHIAPDGSRTLYGRRDQRRSDAFIPNGIALTGDGRLAIANTGLEGGVWQVDRSGDCRPLLMEVDGRHLYPANFVLADGEGRLWISVSTQHVPRGKAYSPHIADGYIVLLDNRGARIVAEGLGYTNECHITNDKSQLFVNETFRRRISSFAIMKDGSLGPIQTVTEFGSGDFPDGGAFDALGHYWVTSVISNRIYRIGPSGKAKLLFEDADPDFLAVAESAFQGGRLDTKILNRDAGKILNHIASITFGGADLRTAYLGTLRMDCLPTFRSFVAGTKPAHWHWTF
jgi:sugar lactone lactonase YvrE